MLSLPGHCQAAKQKKFRVFFDLDRQPHGTLLNTWLRASRRVDGFTEGERGVSFLLAETNWALSTYPNYKLQTTNYKQVNIVNFARSSCKEIYYELASRQCLWKYFWTFEERTRQAVCSLENRKEESYLWWQMTTHITENPTVGVIRNSTGGPWRTGSHGWK